MNVERWLKSRKPAWEQLDALLDLTDRTGVRGLDRQQLQELGRLYRSTSADLSRARALKLGADVQTYLNNLVVRAHNQVYQTDRNRWKDIFQFFWTGFPALIRENIVYVIVATLLFAIPALGGYLIVQKDSTFAQLETAKGAPLVSEELWHYIERKQLWTDALQLESPIGASQIATNNMRVAILAFVAGITYGVGTVYVLVTNGLSIGTTLGLCKVYGMDGRLMAFVSGHGVLELTSIFICGGAGLMMGKALLFPGKLKRADAFRIAGRKATGVFGGTLPIYLIAGCIEGFISPRTDILPETKYLVSLATLVLLVLYLFAPRGKKPTSIEAEGVPAGSATPQLLLASRKR
jgi:Uncharacterized membrane protein